MQTNFVLLHKNGPALWPGHKPLSEVEELKATTPTQIWEATYQGNPMPPSGSIFMKEWWSEKNRYDIGNIAPKNKTIARWLSFDTGLKDDVSNAYSACIVGELWPDYRMAIREVWRERLQFPDLTGFITGLAAKYNKDGKIYGIIIEDKASGISAIQTLRKTAPKWLQDKIIAFNPPSDKETRANQAAVWCRNNCILLPTPSEFAPWLMDFEDELFTFPGSIFKDQVDSFSQLVLWTENLLSEGWRAREGYTKLEV